MAMQIPAGLAQQQRRRAIELLAHADEAMLVAAWSAIEPKPVHSRVRGPETGLLMVRGRIGGGGSPFNLGEATVSRAAVRLSTGEIGHGQTLGISRQKALLGALFDAMGQRPEFEAAVGALLERIEESLAAADAETNRQTAATKVDFFTMVRGED